MSAHRFPGLLVSTVLLAGCGTTIVQQGTGGTDTGTGGAGTDGGCVETSDHTLSGAGLSTACTQDGDCVPVYFGDGCAQCYCDNAAINRSSQGTYAAEQIAKKSGCCPQPDCGIDCAFPVVSCQQGTCVFGSGG